MTPARRSSIKVTVEGFAGAGIDHMAEDMVHLANLLNVTVMSRANGVDMMACPGDNPTSLFDVTMAEMASNKPMKLARAKP